MAENINYHLSVKNNDSNKNVLIKPHEFQNSNHKLIDIADIKFRFPGTGNDDANTIPSSNPDEYYTAGASLENCLVAFAGRDSGTGYDYKVLTIEKLASLLRPLLIFENFTIKWNLNGGSSSTIADTVVSENTAVTWPNSPQYEYTLTFKLGTTNQTSRKYTKTFDTTKSWNTKSDGTGTQVGYKGGTKTWKPTANTTVYAIWSGGSWNDSSFPTPNDLTMTWNLNGSGATIGGSNASSTPTTVKGYYYTASTGGTKKTALPSSLSSATTYYLRYDNIELPSEPVRDGYTFNGWYTTASGGDEVTENSNYTYSKTFYAHWTENAKPLYWYVGIDPITTSTTPGSGTVSAMNASTVTGWHNITGTPTQIQVGEMPLDNSRPHWYIAIPSSLNITKATSGGIVDEGVTSTLKTLADGVSYRVFDVGNAKTFEYLMTQ